MNTIKGSFSDRVFDYINYTVLFLILILVLFPLLHVVSASFSDPMAIVSGKVWFVPVNFHLDSYKRVFQNQSIIIGYKNSAVYTVVGTSVNLVMTTLGAYPLSRKDFVGRNALTLMFSFTMFFSGGLIPTYLTYRSLGLYNNLWVMVLPGAVSMWNLIIMRTFFQNSIPNELQEASFIDGCTNAGTLMRIILPLSKPIIAVMIMYYGVSHWNAYFNSLIYLSNKDLFPLQLVIREILIKEDMFTMTGEGNETIVAQQLLSEGIKYSVIIVASLPALMLYPFLQKYFVKGVMVGAIKG